MATKKETMKKRDPSKPTTYSLDDKIAALKMIEVNGSINKTAKLMGIHRNTIAKWAEDPKLACKVSVDVGKIETLVNKRIEKTEVDLITEVNRVKMAALRRMETLIETTTKLKDVTDAFAVLSGISIGEAGAIDPARGHQVVQNIKQSIQQRIYMVQQNTNDNGTRKIEIDGHSEEQEA